MATEKKMCVKGTAVLALNGFIREKFSDRYEEWLDSLSPDSRRVHENTIMAFKNYLIYDAIVEPTQKACELFYNGDERGCLGIGYF